MKMTQEEQRYNVGELVSQVPAVMHAREIEPLDLYRLSIKKGNMISEDICRRLATGYAEFNLATLEKLCRVLALTPSDLLLFKLPEADRNWSADEILAREA